jgi:hypothetical protein
MAGLLAKSEPIVRAIYDALLKATKKFGGVRVEEKKTSIHLVAGSAFAGVHPRKTAIVLNIRTSAPIKSRRMRKVERVSANRFHNEMLLSSPADVDAEVVAWLKDAHALGAG